jgi:hypothetical protein
MSTPKVPLWIGYSFPIDLGIIPYIQGVYPADDISTLIPRAWPMSLTCELEYRHLADSSEVFDPHF